eukprot:scaffold111756_cov90-Phaeocystis_antarctica.AAC.2
MQAESDRYGSDRVDPTRWHVCCAHTTPGSCGAGRRANARGGGRAGRAVGEGGGEPRRRCRPRGPSG